VRPELPFLRRLYEVSLHLFPKRYRQEYGRELQEVFGLSLEEAATRRGLEVERLVLRELVSLPKAAILEHLREMRKSRMTEKSASRFDFLPGTRSEIWAALAPFLLFGALPTLLGYFRVSDLVPLWLDIVFVIILWSFGLSLILIGYVKRFPRWFMPYIGLPMPIISLLLFLSLMEKLGGVWWYRLPWFLSAFIQQGLLWMGSIFLLILLLVASRLIPKSRSFHQRLRDDWTLLSFIIYGTLPLVLFIILNEYKNEEPFMFLALLILAVGGWLYLQSGVPWNKFLYLQGGVALSLLTVAVGKAILAESSFPVGADTWQIEFMDTIITWLWLAMIMLIPLALNLLPRPNSSAQAS
jgi:hypothetical protein